MTTSNAKDTLFYDGQCPLCAKEIAYLEKKQDGKLALYDIHKGIEHFSSIDKQSMLKKLHLQTTNGEYLVGLEATVKAWSHTPFGVFFKPLRWPIIKPIADKLYNYWAEKRYHKRYDCEVCTTGNDR